MWRTGGARAIRIRHTVPIVPGALAQPALEVAADGYGTDTRTVINRFQRRQGAAAQSLR
jgi:hypothetical protein